MHPPAHEVFPHIRIVMGMVIGLGVARLLSGVARIIQHPERYRIYSVHLVWVFSLLVALIHFWWWEFSLYNIPIWRFESYLFIISYATVLFLICALLFPDSMQGYSSFEDFFHARRAWFFGLLATTYLLDIIDTMIKGDEYFGNFGSEDLIRTPVFVGLCLLAIWVGNRRFHAAFAIATVAYQFTWIFRLFDTIG